MTVRPDKPGPRIGNFKPAKITGMDQDQAEAIGAETLAALAEDPALLVRFMGETGVGPSDLRAAAGTPEMLAAVLEYVLANEPLLLTIAASRNLKPEQLSAALAKLQKPALGSL